jgi:hypothetical protein
MFAGLILIGLSVGLDMWSTQIDDYHYARRFDLLMHVGIVLGICGLVILFTSGRIRFR